MPSVQAGNNDSSSHWWNNLSEFPDGPPKRGISHVVALALVLLDLEIVRRSTLRLLCPPGEKRLRPSGGQRNPVPAQFSRALRQFEQAGWIRREADGYYIRVLNRKALRAWVSNAIDIDENRADTMLRVTETVAHINTRLAEGKLVSSWNVEQRWQHAEVRRQELLALHRLMRTEPGAPPAGKRARRIVPRSEPL